MDSKLDAAAMNGSGLWIEETNAEAWAEACRNDIATWLGALAGDAAFADNLRLKVVPPTKRTAQRAFDSNTTLEGEVRLTWLNEGCALKIPMPFNGVFLFRRERSSHPLVTAWPSWLGEAPGFRTVRPKSEARRAEIEWRLGLPSGRFAGAPLVSWDNLPAKNKKKLANLGLRYIGDARFFPGWLRGSLGLLGPRGKNAKALAPEKAWRALHELVIDGNEISEPSDEEHLDHRILITFPVWLKDRISQGLLAAVRAQGDDATQSRIDEVLRGNTEGDTELGDRARTLLLACFESLGPKITWAINGHQSEEKADFIDPINPLDLVSRITRVRRIHLPASKLQELPACFRQNHPSFKGRLCPVESPESEQVGLSLQLASGATVDFAGRISPAVGPAGELGFGAGLIPFY